MCDQSLECRKLFGLWSCPRKTTCFVCYQSNLMVPTQNNSKCLVLCGGEKTVAWSKKLSCRAHYTRV